MWLVRAGKAGEFEKLAFDNRCAIIGWQELPDLTPCTTRERLKALLEKTYPNEKPKTLINWESQIWPIRETIKVGDLIVLPLKTRADIGFGKVTGDYQYRDLSVGPVHTRPVDWLKEFPRSAFDQDLLFSFGAFMTVCRIERNQAEQRVEAMLYGKKWTPKIVQPSTPKSRELPSNAPLDKTDATALPDIEQQSQDLIRDRIAQRYKGHALATLIAALLGAQGYSTRTSPPGADGGVDIVAGTGPLGFDAPRLIVQVKSQDAPVDVQALRELTGIMGRFHADHALLVGWGGFTRSARSEAAADYFKLRLWDADDVIRAIQAHYERLPEDIRAEIPLKRVWTLVPDEDSA